MAMKQYETSIVSISEYLDLINIPTDATISTIGELREFLDNYSDNTKYLYSYPMCKVREIIKRRINVVLVVDDNRECAWFEHCIQN